MDEEEAMDTSPSSSSSSLSPLDNPQVQSLLLDVYSKIGEPDSLYGACLQYSAHGDIRIRMYEHEHKWEKALSGWM